MSAHFLHIRKCGGSAIRAALGPFAKPVGIVLHNHNTRLSDIDCREPVFFSVRHPVARFISGFNSRLRKGAPLYQRPWNLQEQDVFARYETPDELATALGNPAARRHAQYAMHNISHVRHTLCRTISLEEVARHNVIWIGFQETLDRDFQRLKRMLGLPPAENLPGDPVVAHRTPDNFPRMLSDAARRNLEDWYAEDIALYDALRMHAAAQA